MLHLTNAHLRLDLLDPTNPADAARLGPRFCHGGFIWQIHDLSSPADTSERSGNFQPPTLATPAPLEPRTTASACSSPTSIALLSGPEYPSPTPTPFNAQGLPESFRHRTRDGAPLTWNPSGTQGVAIGAGALTADASGNVTLTEPCTWAVVYSPPTSTPFPSGTSHLAAPPPSSSAQLAFHTRHSAAGFSYALTRTILLAERTVTSSTELTNLGDAPLALEWFAHPFWPLTQQRARLALPAGTTLPDNPGFAVAPDGTLTFQRPFVAPDDSQFALLALPSPLRPAPSSFLPSSPSPAALSLSLDHPTLRRVTFSTSFAPSECPVWANAHTVSVEPYLALRLAPGETHRWHLRHGFESST